MDSCGSVLLDVLEELSHEVLLVVVSHIVAPEMGSCVVQLFFTIMRLLLDIMQCFIEVVEVGYFDLVVEVVEGIEAVEVVEDIEVAEDIEAAEDIEGIEDIEAFQD